MPKLLFAKVSINSKIYDVYEGKESIDKIMEDVFNKINDEEEYVKDLSVLIIDDDDNEKELYKTELYNFSDIERFHDNTNKYIIGKLIRRFPIYSEEFDPDTRKSEKVIYSNNSSSILFYFDLKTEIITFCEKLRFGYNQFNDSFKSLLDIFIKDVGFEVYLIQDPFSIKERMDSAYKITKIKATFIPPNVNEEALKDLYNRNIKDMHNANITKRTSIFDVNPKSEKGIAKDAKMVEEVINTEEAFNMYANGYGRLEVDGDNHDGSKFHYVSDENSPYQIVITNNEKSNKNNFIDISKKGIISLLTKRTIKRYL